MKFDSDIEYAKGECFAMIGWVLTRVIIKTQHECLLCQLYIIYTMKKHKIMKKNRHTLIRLSIACWIQSSSIVKSSRSFFRDIWSFGYTTSSEKKRGKSVSTLRPGHFCTSKSNSHHPIYNYQWINFTSRHSDRAR